MSAWRMPIRLADGTPVIAVFGDGPVWHDTAPQTPEEVDWLIELREDATDG